MSTVYSPVFKVKALISFSPSIDTYPKEKQAAVLVLLLELPSANGETHGGQTSLPGGKRDKGDDDIVTTAYREAHEEIGLPLPDHSTHKCTSCSRCSARHPDLGEAPTTPHVHTLGLLAPLPFRQLLVRPVISFVTRPDLVLPLLKANPGEVDQIFLHPLEGILDPKPIDLADLESLRSFDFGEVTPPSELTPQGGEYWPYDEEFHTFEDHAFESLGGHIVMRDHKFRTCASPVTGMTAEILILLAQATYDKSPTFSRYADGQIEDWGDMSVLVLQTPRDSAGKE
ncbi:hypothetical protein BKA70DRAFT_1107081 [Coprinopsis sp. MPI-PUGE-AT-0042]|nr:hypothetical protein BKA70DRAFT_1107081 [Coprinopsis sp. MPI-PUGE-AT-0042]